jgi:hypothetical protein
MASLIYEVFRSRRRFGAATLIVRAGFSKRHANLNKYSISITSM